MRNRAHIDHFLRPKINNKTFRSGSSEWAETVTSLLYPHNYRLQVPIPHELSQMDNSKHVDKLQALAESYIANNSNFKNLCNLLAGLADASK